MTRSTPALRAAVALLATCALVIPLGLYLHEDAGRAAAPLTAELVTDARGYSTFSTLTTTTDWSRGIQEGTRAANGSLSMRSLVGRLTNRGHSYDYARWTSAWQSPGRQFTQLVPSWSAVTPYGTWLQVFVRVKNAQGRMTTFKNLGAWSTRDAAFKRASGGAQVDALSRVNTDTLAAAPGVRFTAYQVRVQLYRLNNRNGAVRPATTGPTLRAVSAVVSQLPDGFGATSPRLYKKKTVLPVKRFSQMTHLGQNPEYGGGGEAWCSPTSLSMVLAYYGRLPRSANYAWVPRGYADPVVNHVARLTYDYAYRGTGNWPFNTAIGAAYLPDAFVTRLADLRMAERFVRAGIPVIASIRFDRGQLTGAPISASNGHLVVIVGFRADGRPVVNDPAAASNDTVRRIYDRAQFERAWLNGSGGTAYILHDAEHPLPWRPSGTHAW